MALRRFSSSSNSDRGNSDKVLARAPSFSGIQEELIKNVTQRFDCEIVFKLQLSGRALARMCGLERCINLVELNLSNNQLTKLEGLESTLQLRRLVLTSNRIAQLEGLSHLTLLEGLWLQDNRLASLDSLALPLELAKLPALKTLYLQNIDRSQANAVTRVPSYKAAVLAALPGLANLDGERSPHMLNYAELSAEMEAHRASPPQQKELQLPPVPPWLPEGAATAAAAQQEQDSAASADGKVLQQRHATAVKAIDECEMLTHVLREEVAKLRAQLQDKNGGQGAAAGG